MSTQNNPGRFDPSVDNPDEPFFVLLGRDRNAPALVRAWADAREAAGEDPEKVAEARSCAEAMDRWLGLLGRAPAAPGPTHRHYKGGLYRELMRGISEASMMPVVVYQSVTDGRVWTRPAHEFDGIVDEGELGMVRRFTPLHEPDATAREDKIR